MISYSEYLKLLEAKGQWVSRPGRKWSTFEELPDAPKPEPFRHVLSPLPQKASLPASLSPEEEAEVEKLAQQLKSKDRPVGIKKKSRIAGDPSLRGDYAGMGEFPKEKIITPSGEIKLKDRPLAPGSPAEKEQQRRAKIGDIYDPDAPTTGHFAKLGIPFNKSGSIDPIGIDPGSYGDMYGRDKLPDVLKDKFPGANTPFSSQHTYAAKKMLDVLERQKKEDKAKEESPEGDTAKRALDALFAPAGSGEPTAKDQQERLEKMDFLMPDQKKALGLMFTLLPLIQKKIDELYATSRIKELRLRPGEGLDFLRFLQDPTRGGKHSSSPGGFQAKLVDEMRKDNRLLIPLMDTSKIDVANFNNNPNKAVPVDAFYIRPTQSLHKGMWSSAIKSTLQPGNAPVYVVTERGGDGVKPFFIIDGHDKWLSRLMQQYRAIMLGIKTGAEIEDITIPTVVIYGKLDEIIKAADEWKQTKKPDDVNRLFDRLFAPKSRFVIPAGKKVTIETPDGTKKDKLTTDRLEFDRLVGQKGISQEALNDAISDAFENNAFTFSKNMLNPQVAFENTLSKTSKGKFVIPKGTQVVRTTFSTTVVPMVGTSKDAMKGTKYGKNSPSGSVIGTTDDPSADVTPEKDVINLTSDESFSRPVGNGDIKDILLKALETGKLEFDIIGSNKKKKKKRSASEKMKGMLDRAISGKAGKEEEQEEEQTAQRITVPLNKVFRQVGTSLEPVSLGKITYRVAPQNVSYGSGNDLIPIVTFKT